MPIDQGRRPYLLPHCCAIYVGESGVVQRYRRPLITDRVLVSADVDHNTYWSNSGVPGSS